MAKYKKEGWTTSAAATVVALALLVGIFIFFLNKYSDNEETQVTQIPLAPGNELPIAPIIPPASAPITTPSDNPPVNQ